MTEYIGSSAWLIKQNLNAGARQLKFVYADKIDVNKPALVILGGALTTDESKARGYIEHISPIITNRNSIEIYSAVYKFESLDPMLVKANIFRRAGRKIALDMDANVARRREQQLSEINENEPTPGYIEDLYETIIAPRIIRGDAQKTAKNLRNAVIYSHCHGAIVVNQLAEMASTQMKTAGFNDATIKQCMANLIVIQHNPTAPLENTPFTTLNFISSSDDTLNYFDAFSKHLLKKDDLSPVYMGEDYAHAFVAGKLNAKNGSEHGFSIGYKDDAGALTENGKMLFAIEHNAINNAINAAVSGAPLPHPEQLANGNGIDIKQMRHAGQEIYKTFSR